MTNIEKHQELVELCTGSLLPLGGTVVPEPYVPYVPRVWNGMLVVAEAQNLSDTNREYVQRLRNWSPRERIERLQPDPTTKKIGVEPWDDGSLKLAIEAALGIRAEETAVSNAVLWSVTTARGTNDNPTPDLSAASVDLWSKMLGFLRPGRSSQRVPALERS